MAISSQQPLTLGGVVLRSQYDPDFNKDDSPIEVLRGFKQSKMTFEEALQAFEQNPADVSSLITLLRGALEPVPNDLNDLARIDSKIDRLLESEMKLGSEEFTRLLAAGSEVVFGESSEYSISFAQKFQAREKILDYIREKVRSLIAEIIESSESRDKGELATDHVFREQIRILMALEPYFVPKSATDVQFGGLIRKVGMEALQAAEACRITLTPFEFQSQKTSSDVAMHNLKSELEQIDLNQTKIDSKMKETSQEFDQLEKSLEELRRTASKELPISEEILSQMAFRKSAANREIMDLGGSRRRLNYSREKIVTAIENARSNLSLEGLKEEVGNNQVETAKIYQLNLEIQKLEEELGKPGGYVYEKSARLTELRNSFALQKRCMQPLSAILENAARVLEETDRRILVPGSSFKEKFSEFMKLAHFLSMTYSTSLVNLQTELTLGAPVLEKKVAELITAIKELQRGLAKGEPMLFPVTQEQLISVVAQIKSMLISRKEQVLKFTPQVAEKTLLQEKQEEISEQLDSMIKDYPKDRASCISMLMETEYAYLPEVVQESVKGYLLANINACSDEYLQYFVSQLLENQIKALSVEERIEALLNANLEHLPQALRQFRSRDEVLNWLKSIGDAEIQALMYELVQNQIPKVFNRAEWIHILMNADHSNLPVEMKTGIENHFRKGFSATSDAVLMSFVQKVVSNQLKEISAKLTKLAVECEQDENVQVSVAFKELAEKISRYTIALETDSSLDLVGDLQIIKKDVDALLPKSATMRFLDQASFEVDWLASLLGGAKV